jgi:hypothetical protein
MSGEQGVFKVGPATACMQRPLCGVNASRMNKKTR